MKKEQSIFIAQNAHLLKHPNLGDFLLIIQQSPFLVAVWIWGNIPDKGCTLQDLVKATALSYNTVATVVRALEKGKVLRRSPYTEDRRQTFVEKL